MSSPCGRRTEPHEKSMGSYGLFAWRSAMSIADFLREHLSDYNLDLAAARRLFDAQTAAGLREMEEKWADMIVEFIHRTESQRDAYFRKITKKAGSDSEALFPTLCIVACLRAKDILEIRDLYRYSLAPGAGNRDTLAGVYRFADEIRGVYGIEWPREVFDAIGSYCDE